MAAASCLWLMQGLSSTNWWRFGIWLVIGLAIYFGYGARRSRLRAPG
jgi:APA family basic amino acid/polyamine antiporter